jgi:hypothetical protein
LRGYFPGEGAPPRPGKPGGGGGQLPRKIAPRPATPEPKPKGRGRRLDWVVGIALGVALGVAIVAAFLFFGSEETIDAPSISGAGSGQPARSAPASTAPTTEP